MQELNGIIRQKKIFLHENGKKPHFTARFLERCSSIIQFLIEESVDVNEIIDEETPSKKSPKISRSL